MQKQVKARPSCLFKVACLHVLWVWKYSSHCSYQNIVEVHLSAKTSSRSRYIDQLQCHAYASTQSYHMGIGFSKKGRYNIVFISLFVDKDTIDQVYSRTRRGRSSNRLRAWQSQTGLTRLQVKKKKGLTRLTYLSVCTIRLLFFQLVHSWEVDIKIWAVEYLRFRDISI